MPLLKTEADKLSNNDLIRGVVEEIIDADEVFQFLPFVKTEGKAYVYNREATLAASQFITVNVDVPEAASTFTEITTTLRIIVGDVDVDNFLSKTESDTNDQKAVQIAMKAKSVARLFSDKLINGKKSTAYNLTALGGAASVSGVEFDGLDAMCVTSQQIDAGTNGAALTLEMLDQLLDNIKMGADALIMTRREFRSYQKLLRASGGMEPMWIELDNGKRMASYAGMPILINDFISVAQTKGTSTAASRVYAIRMNEVDGVHGVYGGDNVGMEYIELGQLEKRDATRSRIRWYCTVALKSTMSLAFLDGVLAE